MKTESFSGKECDAWVSDAGYLVVQSDTIDDRYARIYPEEMEDFREFLNSNFPTKGEPK